jgi:hypothetical protein
LVDGNAAAEPALTAPDAMIPAVTIAVMHTTREKSLKERDLR